MIKSSGVVIYRGPSLLDARPVVVVVTGLAGASANTKTGGMVQTWILRDGIHPVDAVRTGADASVCGQCPLRPALAAKNAARCYVNHGFGPASIHRALARGAYPTVTPAEAGEMIRATGRPVRLGAYGDPGAVPAGIWDALTAGNAYTGYTHQWRRSPALRGLCMASVGSAAEAAEAESLGWRTFRVRAASEALRPGEIVCPASAEGGHRVQCADCRLCAGASRVGARSVAIIDHGPTSRAKTTA